MNRIRLAVRRGGCIRRAALGLAMACALGVGVPAQAVSAHGEEAQPWPEVETVRTLLRAEAAAALADCRMPGVCGPNVSRTDPPLTSRKTDTIRVAAIFGSTKRLNVDIYINGALLRYRAGHGAPIAGVVEADGYQLLAVEGACVHLRRGEQDHTTCLDVGRAQP